VSTGKVLPRNCVTWQSCQMLKNRPAIDTWESYAVNLPLAMYLTNLKQLLIFQKVGASK